MADQELRLTALQARNPLGFLAAVGTLEVAARFFPEARLRWSGSLNPRAVLTGVCLEDLHGAVSRDQGDLADSPILNWAIDGSLLVDLKMSGPELSAWAAGIQADVLGSPDRDWLSDLWC